VCTRPPLQFFGEWEELACRRFGWSASEPDAARPAWQRGWGHASGCHRCQKQAAPAHEWYGRHNGCASNVQVVDRFHTMFLDG
jgi:hypothetical protein